MKKSEMIELFRKSVDTKPLIRLHLKYDAYYTYWFPFGASKKLFYALKEEDFITNGYSIRRFRDIKKFEIKDDAKYVDILKAEKVFRWCFRTGYRPYGLEQRFYVFKPT